MSQPPRQSGHGPSDPEKRIRPEGSPVRDLGGRRPEEIGKERRREALRSRLALRRHLPAVRAAYRALRDSLWESGPTRALLLVGFANFSVAVILAGAGVGTLAVLPALVGFGLSLAALLYASLPGLASRISRLDRPQWLALWIFLTVLFAFLGFSSVAVIVVVLFVAGFTATHVFWDLLNRILLGRDRRKGRGLAQAAGNPNPFLLAFAGISAWSAGASFLMIYLRVHEFGPLGVSFLTAHIGLVLGLLPLEIRLLQEARRPTIARWSLFRPRRLVRDVLFVAVASAVVGAELSIASGSGVFSGIPTLALVLVLFGYLGVVARQISSLRGRARPYPPLVLPAFGMLLLFAPLVVLLSNPPGVLTQLYGAAQAAGILTGVPSVFLVGLWRERARRLRARFEEVLRERVPLEEAEEGEKSPYERIAATSHQAERDEVWLTEASRRRERREDPREEE
ncbi:MAG: hypothetical protein ACE5LS_06740 [Thermoplasmata archaeon]